MGQRNGHNIGNGVLSVIILLCGVSFSALIASLVKKVTQPISADIINGGGTGPSSLSGIGNYINARYPFWAIGFAYMVPGFLGILAAIFRKKGLYITQMVFCILTLLVMGISFILGIYALTALAVISPDSCLTSGNVCKCGGLEPSTYEYTCEDLTSMYEMGVSLIVVIVLAWVLTLAVTIVCGILACRQEPLQQGVIIQPVPAQAYVYMNSVPGFGQQGGYVPPSNDNAKLVPNMQY